MRAVYTVYLQWWTNDIPVELKIGTIAMTKFIEID